MLLKLPIVPPIAYRTALTGDDYVAKEERQVESRLRLWASVWWRRNDVLYVGEMGVITESMPDFCGGLLVYSPMVGWSAQTNSWTSDYLHPGHLPQGDETDTTWENFKEDSVIDLAKYTGEDDWTAQKFETYAYECLATWAVSQANAQGKRSFVSADYSGGRVTHMMDTLSRMGTVKTSVIPAYCTPGKPTHSPTLYLEHTSCVIPVDVRRDNEWYNANSGNMVQWTIVELVSGQREDSDYVICESCGEEVDRSYYDYCPECDEYLPEMYQSWDMVHMRYPDWLRDVLSNGYHMKARRHFWRNG